MKFSSKKDEPLKRGIVKLLEGAGEPMSARQILNALNYDGHIGRLAQVLSAMVSVNQLDRAGNSGRYKYALASSNRGMSAPMRPLKIDYTPPRRSPIEDAPSLPVERHIEQLRAGRP